MLRMLKSRWLFLNARRAAIIANRSQIRCKTQCMDGSIIPAPFRGPPTIIVNSPYSVKIEPLDPVEYSNLQVVVGFLYVKTEVEEDLPDQVKTKFQKDIQYKVQSVLSPTRDYLEVSCSKQEGFKYPAKDVYHHFYVPANYSVEVKVTDEASVDVWDLEGHVHEIISDKGSCHLTNIRGSRLSVETSGGDITCDSQLLSEFGILDTKGRGKILVKKLQGRKFCLNTQDGSIDVGASYLLRAELTSKGGQVNLGDIHGLTEVDVVKGDVTIGSASGKLKAVTKAGNIDVSLSLHKDVVLKTEQGNIDVQTLQDSVSSELLIKAKTVSINSNVNVVVDEEDRGSNFTVMTGKLNPTEDVQEGKKTVKLEAKLGHVKLEKRDWLSTLKLS